MFAALGAVIQLIELATSDEELTLRQELDLVWTLLGFSFTFTLSLILGLSWKVHKDETVREGDAGEFSDGESSFGAAGGEGQAGE
jgi:hypothetical protein